jgi:hypothetical protein
VGLSGVLEQAASIETAMTPNHVSQSLEATLLEKIVACII